MRIAQIAPLAESCPPRFYGGTERIVSYLTEELVEQGHEVTLFASGDSQTRAELVACAETALRLNPAVKDTIPYHMVMLDRVRRRAAEFDVLHFHIDLLQFPLIHEFAGKTVTTLCIPSLTWQAPAQCVRASPRSRFHRRRPPIFMKVATTKSSQHDTRGG